MSSAKAASLPKPFLAGVLPLLVCFLLPARVPAIRPAGWDVPYYNLRASATKEVTRNSTASSDFIVSSCGRTEYPDVCCTTLGAYSGKVRQSPRQLAQIAVAVSLSRAHRAAAYVASVIQSSAVDGHYMAEVLHDCQDTVSDAVGLMRDSLREMRAVAAGGGGSWRLHVSNVQTWMSAALTNVDTCSDELDDVANGVVKAGVTGRLKLVAKVTANALALVNLLVGGV